MLKITLSEISNLTFGNFQKNGRRFSLVAIREVINFVN